MNFQLIFLAVILIFQSVSAFACDEGSAQISERSYPKGSKEILVCRNGTYKVPSVSELNQFVKKARPEFDKWTGPMTEGQLKTADELVAYLDKQFPIEEMPISNKLADNSISAEQTELLEKMVAKWNEVMEITPQKRENIFDMENFNAAGKANSDVVQALHHLGKDCYKSPNNLRGYEIQFSDGEKSTIIPIEMTRISGRKFKIKYHQKNFLQDLSPLMEREIEIDGSGKVTWRSPSGDVYYLNAQASPVVSTEAMFRASWGVNSGTGGPLCVAEREIERLKGDQIHRSSAGKRAGKADAGTSQ